ncbi:MAG: acetyl-CoA carboxylase biotin carboxyl carrier protein [Bacteroidetes bacterium]|nr:acetyl-CoA carboxylase biotin carboxyl carrier protein [Bacteroidota bacterium]
MIEINYLKQLLEIFDASTVNDLRIERDGVEIRLSKSPRHDAIATQVHYAPMPMPVSEPAVAAPAASAHAAPAPAPAPAAPAPEANYHEIRSPIVGTFYRSPSPSAPPFVEVGAHITPGEVLCIVEAMKLMNEIESDVAGRIVKIVAENGQPVEYNQLLFLVEPD